MGRLVDFKRRQEDLRRRLGRQAPRSIVRRRLERELRALVHEELQGEIRPRLAPVPEYPEDDDHRLEWWQR